MKKIENTDLVYAVDEFALHARSLILGKSEDNSTLFEAVQKKGIELFGIYDDKYDGICLWNGKTNKPRIYLNMEQPMERRLFTLAHEIGHLFIDHGWSPNGSIERKDEEVLSVSFRDKDKSEDTQDIKEKIANQFAGTFLMPEELVDNLIIKDMINLVAKTLESDSLKK